MDSHDKFNQLIAQIHGSSLESPSKDAIPIDIQREEFMAMVRAFLGDEYDRNKTERLYSLQLELIRRQGELAQEHDLGNVTDDQFIELYNTNAYDIFSEMERVLGSEDYLKIFGPRPDPKIGFLDRDIFLKAQSDETISSADLEAEEKELRSWVSALNTGQLEASQDLWERYRTRLVDLARESLHNQESTAQVALVHVIRGLSSSRLNHPKDHDSLWWILLATTNSISSKHLPYSLAKNYAAALQYPLDVLISAEPTVEVLERMSAQHSRLLKILRDDRTRGIANARIEGYSINEIAVQLSLPTKTVSRQLATIRDTWSKYFIRIEVRSRTR